LPHQPLEHSLGLGQTRFGILAADGRSQRVRVAPGERVRVHAGKRIPLAGVRTEFGEIRESEQIVNSRGQLIRGDTDLRLQGLLKGQVSKEQSVPDTSALNEFCRHVPVFPGAVPQLRCDLENVNHSSAILPLQGGNHAVERQLKLLAGRTQDLADVEAIIDSGADRELLKAAVARAVPDCAQALDERLCANVDRSR
jgi:hypothetical protein